MRAQVEMPFRWIYISMVTALLLLVVVSSLIIAKRAGTQSVTNDIVDHLRHSVIMHYGTNALSKIAIRDQEITISCNSIDVSDQTISNEFIPLFSPPLIEDEFFVVGVDYNTVFDLSFVALIPQDISIILMNDSDEMSNFILHFPGQVPHQLITSDQTIYDEKSIIVRGTYANPSVTSRSSKLIIVDDDEVTYSIWTGSHWNEIGTVALLHPFLSLAAVFSSYGQFTCQQDKMKDALEIQLHTMRERMNNVAPHCDTSQIINLIDQFLTQSQIDSQQLQQLEQYFNALSCDVS